LLGVPALVGRTIADIDDQRDGGSDGPVAMLSYGFWQRQFGGALNAIGQRITIEHVPFTIVGVTPPAFFGADVGRTFDVIVPIGTDSLVRGRQKPARSEIVLLAHGDRTASSRSDNRQRHRRLAGSDAGDSTSDDPGEFPGAISRAIPGWTRGPLRWYPPHEVRPASVSATSVR